MLVAASIAWLYQSEPFRLLQCIVRGPYVGCLPRRFVSRRTSETCGLCCRVRGQRRPFAFRLSPSRRRQRRPFAPSRVITLRTFVCSLVCSLLCLLTLSLAHSFPCSLLSCTLSLLTFVCSFVCSLLCLLTLSLLTLSLARFFPCSLLPLLTPSPARSFAYSPFPPCCSPVHSPAPFPACSASYTHPAPLALAGTTPSCRLNRQAGRTLKSKRGRGTSRGWSRASTARRGSMVCRTRSTARTRS